MELSPQTLSVIASIWLTMLGLIIGSFLNVVIARVPHGLSVVRPRSRCPHCGHEITWFENIPVLSWVFLRAKCSGCHAPISFRYPAIELLTGALYLACLVRFDWTIELALALVFVSFLIPLTFIDLEHWILPFELTLPGLAAGLALSAVAGMERLLASVIGAATGFLSFWLLEWVGEKVFKKEALGGGDKYLLAMIGAYLTYAPLVGVAFLSSVQGAIVGLLLLWTRGRAGPAPKDETEPTIAEPAKGAEAEVSVQPEANDEAGTQRDAESTAPMEQHTVAEVLDPPSAQSESAPVSTEDISDEEDDWQPGPTNLPFGPWLSLAAIEILLFAPSMTSWLPRELEWFVGG